MGAKSGVAKDLTSIPGRANFSFLAYKSELMVALVPITPTHVNCFSSATKSTTGSITLSTGILSPINSTKSW